MKKFQSVSARALTTAFGALAFLAAPGYAQEAPGVSADEGIGDIVVTAQRREESLQRSSVVVEVIGEDQLAAVGATQATDLTRVSPGISVSGSTPAPQIYIRGVGDFNATAINNPAVAFNIDGVYVARTEAIGTEMFDLERVEVLKGPQGTLYGRNASGGAVNLITARPRLGEFSGAASGEFGNLDALTANVALNVPLGESFAVRVAGQVVQRDGYTDANRGDIDSEGFRARALWELSPSVSLLLSANYGAIGGRGPATGVINSPLGDYIDSTGAAGVAYITSQIAPSFLPPNLPPGGVVAPTSEDAFQDMQFVNYSAQLDVDLGFATLTVLPARRETEISYISYPFVRLGFGAGFQSTTDGFIAASPETSDMTSLEVRLSNSGDLLTWVLGGYYYEESQYSQYTVFSGPVQNLGVISSLDTEAFALFGQGTLNLSDAFRLIAGVRYTEDERSLSDGRTYNLPGSLGAPGLVETFAGSETFDNVSWKAGFEWDVAENSMFFLTVSSGFKAGGFNQQAALGTPGVASSFEPEELTSYDIGLKNRFYDNRLQLNLSAFYWDYQDQQVNRFSSGNVGNIGIVFDNAGSAEIYGAGFDLIAKPWRGGTFNAAVEYTHSEYQEFVYDTAALTFSGSTGCAATPNFTPPPVNPFQTFTIDCSGQELARTPEITASAGYAHEFGLSSGALITLAGDVTYASERWLSFDYVPNARADAYAIFNASAEFESADGAVTILGFVRNITDEPLYTGASQPNYTGLTDGGVLIGSLGPPQTYGVRIGFNF